MIAYLIKTTVCAALFSLAYSLLLKKATMHRFNRFYLLSSLIFSFAIPLIKIKTTLPILPVASIIQPTDENVSVTLSQPASTTTNTHESIPFPLTDVLLFVYVVITVLLLFRFIKNLVDLFYTIKHNPTVSYSKATLVLVQEQVEPHTFLQFVFINKAGFENGAIEQEILHHELAHVQQKHSIDILMIEFLLVFVWFNPILYFYKKAIQLNHEFLADDAVTHSYGDTRAYQLLLLSKASSTNNIFLTNHFNYSITKKRLIMLTKTTSHLAAICRQIAALMTAVVITFSFGEKGLAQNKPIQYKDTTVKPEQREKDTTHAFVWGTWGGTKEGVTQEMMDEYAAIVNKYKTTDSTWTKYFWQKITPEDKERLITIFKQMSKEQQHEQTVLFGDPGEPLPKITPTTKQFEAFKNSKIYGVWIDDKKVKNTILNNYTNTDFSQVSVSKLYVNAKKTIHYAYSYQVNLMTTDYYKKYYQEANARTEPVMIIVQKFKQGEQSK